MTFNKQFFYTPNSFLMCQHIPKSLDFHYQTSCACKKCKNIIKCKGVGPRNKCLVCNGTVKLMCIHDILNITNNVKTNKVNMDSNLKYAEEILE